MVELVWLTETLTLATVCKTTSDQIVEHVSFNFILTFFSLAFFESTFNPFKVNPCASVTCLNGGNCIVNANNQAVCNCRQGYSGPFCGTFDVCASQPCLNGGICIQTVNSYYCVCLGNYNGINCENSNYLILFPLFFS
jgi:hypothetical protein